MIFNAMYHTRDNSFRKRLRLSSMEIYVELIRK